MKNRFTKSILFFAATAFVVLSTGCAGPSKTTKLKTVESSESGTDSNQEKKTPDSEDQTIETVKIDGVKTDAVEVAEPLDPVEVQDPCASYNESQKNRLSDQQHIETYGCPPCPCACINGKITCAPCARCVPQDRPKPRLEPKRLAP